jgi:hypothetical protein
LYDDPELEAIEGTLSQILEDEKTANRQKLTAEEIITGEDILTPNLDYSVLHSPIQALLMFSKLYKHI